MFQVVLCFCAFLFGSFTSRIIPMGYTKQALLGFSWQTILRVVIAGITIIKIFFLARLLSPQDFGLFSLVTIALGIAEATTQTGVNITLLQVKDSLSSYISSAWIIAIIRGILISLLMIALGYGLQTYYQQPGLFVLISLSALIPFIKGFINPYVISMQKNFEFSKEARYYGLLQLIEAVTAVTLGFIFQQAWILIASVIVAALIEVTLSFVVFSIKPTFSYNSKRGGQILKQTKYFSIGALFSYLLENMDNLIVGKILGTTQLGLYHNGYALSHKATFDFAHSFHHSAFPVFNTIRDDKKRLKKAFNKLLISVIGLTCCLAIPFFIMPELIVRLILGEQWLGVTATLPWLVIAGITYSVALIHYTVLYTLNRLMIINLHLALSLVLLVISVVLGATSNGLVGAAQGIAISRVISLPFLIYYTYRELR